MKSDILEYLNAIKKFHKNQSPGAIYYKWILKNGKLFTEKIDSKKFNKIFKKRFKGCYYNAQMLALDNKELKYYEGWGISEGIGFPLDHGFNVAGGKVVDISWPDGIEYFGIEIPLDFIRKEMLRTETAGTILFQWWMKNKINSGGN
jgi:hypothetical protein